MMTQHTPDDRWNDLLAALADLSADTDYTRGVRDLLEALGLTTAGEGSPLPGGEVSGYVLASLRAHLLDGVPVAFRWDDLDGPAPRGVDLLRRIEAARADAVPEPTPAREVQVVQAIIKRQGADGGEFLLQFDRHAGRYQPLGGKADPTDASAAAALRREIAEELALETIPGPDRVALDLLKAGWTRQELSATYGVLTAYTFSFYHARRLAVPVTTDVDTRWLPQTALLGGQAPDGRAVSPILRQALGRSSLENLANSVLS